MSSLHICRRVVSSCFFSLMVAVAISAPGVAVFGDEPHGAAVAGVSPQAALEKLKAGNKRFVEQKLADKDLAQRRTATANGQQPYAIILACADSRVAPELVFDETIGDLFVIRVAGNVVDPDVLGSVEYAVEHLHARLIVVLGHEKCGAVTAALSREGLHGNLDELIHKVAPGDNLPDDKSRALPEAIKHNALHQAQEMVNQSEPIKKVVDEHDVQIEAAVYSLDSGEVKWLENK
ncbi:MAG TPA: carbonic anhydrase [Tepidisphaeraceae bacterium]|nr:carbonic anhydrase [Tepidisphaeraceae bacterium]